MKVSCPLFPSRRHYQPARLASPQRWGRAGWSRPLLLAGAANSQQRRSPRRLPLAGGLAGLLLLGLLLSHSLAAEAPPLLVEAKTATDQVADPETRALLLAELAAAWAAHDVEVAEQLLAEAVASLEVVEEPLAQVLGRRGVAVRIQAWQPDRAAAWLKQAAAEARALPYPAQQALALREIARSAAATDAAAGRSLLAEAAKSARQITQLLLRTAALRDLAEVAWVADEEMARDLLEEASHALLAAVPQDQPLELARAELAVAWASHDPETALSEAGRIGDAEVLAACRLRLCEVLAPADPDLALHLASLQEGAGARALALATVAAHLPASQAELAATLARSALNRGADLVGEAHEALAAAAALGLARNDPAGALGVARELQDPDTQAATFSELAARLVASHPQEALALAHDIDDWLERERCLSQLVSHLSSSNRDLALQVARGLGSPRARATALLTLANLSGG